MMTHILERFIASEPKQVLALCRFAVAEARALIRRAADRTLRS
jgi:hypothetical protein